MMNAQRTGSKATKSVPDDVVPIGKKTEDGSIVPFTTGEKHDVVATAVAEAQYAGRLESVPSCIGQLVST